MPEPLTPERLVELYRLATRTVWDGLELIDNAEVAALIEVLRDAWVAAGRWPCVCGHAHLGMDCAHKLGWCREYRARSLEAAGG